MSLFISALASGSNGNCYYIGNENEAILVDAGISCREIEKRMKRLGLCLQKIKGIFVSHEHSDHIRGIHSIAKKHRLPIYITQATSKHGGLYLHEELIKPFKAFEPILIGDLAITAFPKLHDASDPYSFIVSCKKIKVGVFTDIGLPCENVIKHFSQCHAAFLEANYDDEMLDNGAYPYHLIKRICGERGHLSNTQALDVFRKHKPPFMSHLFLSHLSKNNNCPELVKELFEKYADGVKMIVASRYEETSVYSIHHEKEFHFKIPKQQPAPQLKFSFA
jgi:phosphoribosyl 1,2-cyclic phosphodiesterase